MFKAPRKERELDKLKRKNHSLPLAKETRQLLLIPAKLPAAIVPSISTAQTETTEEHSAKYIIAKSLIWLGAILLAMSECGFRRLRTGVLIDCGQDSDRSRTAFR